MVTQAGYTSYDDVVYLYEEELDLAKTAGDVIALLIGATTGTSWGLTAIQVVFAYGGKSALEKAVDEAYYSGRGIAVYCQIHHSVQSYNKVRYVVEIMQYKKYFKFTKFRKDLKPFMLVMLIVIVCQCYDGWSIHEMIKTNIILVVVGIFGSLISDWIQIKNDNSKNSNSKES